MRPRGIPSRLVKVLPWYYTEKKQPTRAAEREDTLSFEYAADSQDDPGGSERFDGN